VNWKQVGKESAATGLDRTEASVISTILIKGGL
jgi:hypothetical protein